MRRHGFGVHSPFAFDFIRRVIAQPCRYYCYPELTATARSAGMNPGQLRLLFRIALFFKPEKFLVFGKYARICSKAIKLGAPQARGWLDDRLWYEDIDLYVITPGQPKIASDEPEMEPYPHLQTIKVTVCFHDKPTDKDFATVVWEFRPERGMLFKSSTATIYIDRSDLPHQRFDLWF